MWERAPEAGKGAAESRRKKIDSGAGGPACAKGWRGSAGNGRQRRETRGAAESRPAPEAGRVQPGVGVRGERGAQVGAGARNREGRSWE